MAKFSYLALGADGAQLTGTVAADTLGQAHAVLVEQGAQPVEVTEKRSIWQFEITQERVKGKELVHVCRQLAVFIKAGITVLDALETIAEETPNARLRRSLLEIAEALRGGSTFADAAAQHPYVFPAFSLGIIRSAELTGNLDTVLDQLAEYVERDLEAKQKVKSALTYPAIILGMATITCVVLAAYVLPRFENFFDSFDADLPLPTRILLATTDFITNWWWLGALVLVGLLAGFLVSLRTEGGRDARDRFLLKVPVLGDLLRHAILERFCRVFASMMHAGVPVADAMTVTGEACNNVVYREGIAEAREGMLRGEGLAGPLAATGLFPPAARQMFRVGEETGTLDEQMSAAAAYFDRELDHRIRRFTDLFEPAVIIAVGVVVGFVAIALVSAMYGIYDQADL